MNGAGETGFAGPGEHFVDGHAAWAYRTPAGIHSRAHLGDDVVYLVVGSRVLRGAHDVSTSRTDHPACFAEEPDRLRHGMDHPNGNGMSNARGGDGHLHRVGANNYGAEP